MHYVHTLRRSKIADAQQLVMLSWPHLTVLALQLPPIPPAPAAVAPCPRRQLLFYVAHAGGSGDPEVACFARPLGEEAPSSWLPVGSVAAAGPPDAALAGGASAAAAATGSARGVCTPFGMVTACTAAAAAASPP